MVIAILSCLIVVLLIWSAFNSLAEIAMFSFNKLKLNYLVKQGNLRAAEVSKVLSKPDKLISTILIANTIANIAITDLAIVIATKFLSAEAAYTIASVIALIVLVIFGEMMPKILGSQYNERISLKIITPLKVMIALLTPLAWLSTGLTDAFFKMLGIRIAPRAPHITREELKHMVELSGAGGHIQADESRMIRAIFAMNDKLVGEIMIPKEKVVAVDIKSPTEKIVAYVDEEGYSRVPVYDGSLDNIKGVVHSKDLLNILLYKGLIIMEDIVREPYFVHKDQKISEVLKMFRKGHLHLAIVKDENDKVTGIITIEDILEEIVGEIEDEYDIG